MWGRLATGWSTVKIRVDQGSPPGRGPRFGPLLHPLSNLFALPLDEGMIGPSDAASAESRPCSGRLAVGGCVMRARGAASSDQVVLESGESSVATRCRAGSRLRACGDNRLAHWTETSGTRRRAPARDICVVRCGARGQRPLHQELKGESRGPCASRGSVVAGGWRTSFMRMMRPGVLFA